MAPTYLAERTNCLWKSDSGRFCPRIYTAIPIKINPRTTAIGTAIGSRSGLRLEQQLVHEAVFEWNRDPTALSEFLSHSTKKKDFSLTTE